ncbi:DUF2573 family protein [Bacillus sp. FJAT-44742]|uniref:DUF2573 family protein n=1 Tax=Bacillus sp. FJAT-44742 TaxID=2014005 RepID=UPI000C230C81|nr:DUF2573 family protein [Bacillus sp. FJAT-44742]
MDKQFQEQVDGLLEKYTELLLGESTPELKKKVETWALYMHISKNMPPLTRHWIESYPDAKESMRELAGEIKRLNEANRKKEKED